MCIYSRSLVIPFICTPLMALAVELGDFPLDQLAPIETGGSLTYECYVGDQAYVIRYPLPNDTEHPYTIHQAAALTTRLAPAVSAKIPAYTVSKNQEYLWYPKLEGTAVSKDVFQALGEEQKNTLAAGLGRFIYEMQHALTPVEAAQLEVRKEDEFFVAEGQMPRVIESAALNSGLYEKIFTRPDCQHLQPFWEHILPLYNKAMLDTRFHGIVHNDLHGGNFLIDESTGELKAVIDFSLYAQGNVLRDMRHLYSLSSDFFEAAVREYCKVSGINDESEIKEVIQMAYVFRAYRDFSNVLKAIAYPKYADEAKVHQDMMVSVNFLNDQFKFYPELKSI